MARDLRGKLRRSFGAAGARDVPSSSERPVASGSGLRAYLDRRRSRLAGAPRPEVDLEGGDERSNALGSFWLRRVCYPLADEHGAFPLGLAAAVDWARVADRLAERPLQVTFVGKSFDRHRLHTRMSLHRIDSAVLDPRHLDLYHLVRRAWKGELPDCRLRTVEERRLGVRRSDDLPGSEAPQAWLDWLRDRTGPVDRVLEHNRLDVLSLVTLLGVLGRA